MNYEIVDGQEKSLTPPLTFDSYAGALNRLVKLNRNMYEQGFVTSPILNGQFVYYHDGESDEQGNILQIIPMED